VLAENGEQAVARAAEERFDVVLMDVQMPVLDGIEATQRIRMLPPPHNAVPVVALTANVMEAERRRCMEGGMNEVLTKPVAWDALFRTLAGIGAGGAAPSRTPAGGASPVQALLLDQERIAGLAAMAGPAKLAQFLANALASAEQLSAEVQRLQDDLAAVAHPAHRLAGTAPSFGLSRVGTLGRAIEQGALQGQEVAGLVGQLKQAVAETRHELQRLKLLPSAG
jgi:two-component system, sensor histidine kinase